MNDTFAILVLLICLDVAGGAIAGGCLRWLVRHDWSDPDWFWEWRQDLRPLSLLSFADYLVGIILILSISPFLGVVVFAGTEAQYLAWFGLLLYIVGMVVGALTPDSVATSAVPIIAGAFLIIIGAILYVTLADSNLLGALVAFAGIGGLGGYVLVSSAFRGSRP